LNTDKTWERYGKVDPYFGVITHSRYHAWMLTDQARDDFFESGAAHVRRLMEALREIEPAFSPKRALDFGCGVGRVTLPLARESKSVLGVDVAGGMLAEAQNNATERGVTNVRFAREVSGNFDLVHCFIVLQHISPARGLPIIRDLASRVDPGGMIVLQVPYQSNVPAYRKLAASVARVVPIATWPLNLVRGRAINYPTMATFCYDLGSIFLALRDAGFGCLRILLDTEAGPDYASATIYGQNVSAT
jgi:2-polyprenyl-3-methyl-5-hydroxy-6-metoxy-1,4-benzoquinol methylase